MFVYRETCEGTYLSVLRYRDDLRSDVSLNTAFGRPGDPRVRFSRQIVSRNSTPRWRLGANPQCPDARTVWMAESGGGFIAWSAPCKPRDLPVDFFSFLFFGSRCGARQGASHYSAQVQMAGRKIDSMGRVLTFGPKRNVTTPIFLLH